MTSHEEAKALKVAILRAVNQIERAGFTRGQIGAAMVGMGAGFVAVHEGRAEADRALDSARVALSEKQG